MNKNQLNIVYVSYDEIIDIKRNILYIEASDNLQIHIFETANILFTEAQTKDLYSLGYNINIYSIEKEPFIEKHWYNIINKYSFLNILLLCADEQLPLSERDQIELLKTDSAEFARENLVGDYVLRGGGWGVNQDYQLRYFKNPILTEFLTAPHVLPFKIPNNIKRSKLIMRHKSYKNLHQFIERFNRYTSLDSQFDSSDHSSMYMMFRSMKHFFRRYIMQFGYRDGTLGFILCALMGLYFPVNNLKSKGK